MKNWTILFVKSKKEREICEYLKKNLRCDLYLPFVPEKEAYYKIKGVSFTQRELLFPGYVFIQTSIEADEIAANFKMVLQNIAENNNEMRENIYKLLHYTKDNRQNVVLRENEREYWQRLLGQDFCVKGSAGIVSDEKITITSGPMLGLEGKIKWINKHKREAAVETEIMGQLTEMKFMLEVMEENQKENKKK